MSDGLLLGLLAVIAGCQAAESDLRGYPPPCLDGWRACGGECIPGDEVCGPITYATSSSGYQAACDALTFELSVPEAETLNILVAGCVRSRPGLPLPEVSYRGSMLAELGNADSTSVPEPGGDFVYRSVLFWGAGLAAGPGQVSTNNSMGQECWFTALAYADAAPDRPDYHGAITNTSAGTITIESATDEVVVASLCMKVYNTTALTLHDDDGQVRRNVTTPNGGYLIAAAADKSGTAPAVTLGWADETFPDDPGRRGAISGLALQPYCPTCIRTPRYATGSRRATRHRQFRPSRQRRAR